jgi:lipopolysaccharide/colanic/teichoic acid biosynthesis glycosyltransferase
LAISQRESASITVSVSQRSADAIRTGRDALLALLAIFVLMPLLVLIAVMVRLDSRGPVLFRQERAGRYGRSFHLLKFRSLYRDAPGEAVTPEGAVSITRVGRVLRRYRLDELPQFFNLLTGRLALIGPRPELAADLVELDADIKARLLSIKPGITGPAQLEFIAEDALLASCENPTLVYRQTLMPAKASLNIREFESRSVLKELRWLLATPIVLMSRQARQGSLCTLKELLSGNGNQ